MWIHVLAVDLHQKLFYSELYLSNLIQIPLRCLLPPPISGAKMTSILKQPSDFSEILPWSYKNRQGATLIVALLPGASWIPFRANIFCQQLAWWASSFSGLDTWYSVYYTPFQVTGKWIHYPGKFNFGATCLVGKCSKTLMSHPDWTFSNNHK